MLRPSYFLSDLHRGLRASCETFTEKPNDAPSSLSVIRKEASALLVGDTFGKQSLRRSPTPTGFAEFVRDMFQRVNDLGCGRAWLRKAFCRARMKYWLHF
jgi:hypothetical protein